MKCQAWHLVALALFCAPPASSETCPGTVEIDGFGLATIVPTGWGSTDGVIPVHLHNGQIVADLGARAYLANQCNPGVYNHTQYLAFNLLGKTMRYTTDFSGLGCGCNAAFYLTSMYQNTHKSECNDYYCDANNVCGESCAEIDIQEGNQYAWHSTLHSAKDHSGLGMGLGGGGGGWNGPRDWTSAQYGPGAECIDTDRPFEVAVSFPASAECELQAMIVTLSQEGHTCPLSVRLGNYPGMREPWGGLQELPGATEPWGGQAPCGAGLTRPWGGHAAMSAESEEQAWTTQVFAGAHLWRLRASLQVSRSGQGNA